MVRACLRDGLRRAGSARRAALVLWLANLLLALPAALPVFAWLREGLALAPEGDRLLQGYSAIVLVELAEQTPPGRFLGPLAAALAGLALLANALLAGGVVQVLLEPGEGPLLQRFGRGAGRFCGRFLRLGLLAAVTLAVAVGLILAGAGLLRRRLEDSTWEPAPFLCSLLGGLVALLAGLLVLLALDVARLRVAGLDPRGTWRTWASSLRFVLRHPLRLLGLWLASAALAGTAVAAYLGLGALLPPASWAGLVLLALLQQAVLLARAGARLLLWASLLALWERSAPAPAAPALSNPVEELSGLPSV